MFNVHYPFSKNHLLALHRPLNRQNTRNQLTNNNNNNPKFIYIYYENRAQGIAD